MRAERSQSNCSAQTMKAEWLWFVRFRSELFSRQPDGAMHLPPFELLDQAPNAQSHK
jgi:hypothetical protein